MLALNRKLYWVNVKKIQDILIQNRGYIKETPKDEHVLLLCSGGMDSTILIDMVIRYWNCNVIVVYFQRNAKNQKWEEKAVEYFYDFYKQRFPNNIKDYLKINLEIPLRLNKEHFDRTRQKVLGLPLRNTVMWGNAFAQAVYLSGKYTTTIRTILIGSVEEDITSPESGILSVLSQTLHTCIAMGVWYYQLLAPFIEKSFGSVICKVDLLKYAKEFQIPIEKSRSCFEADEQPCNKCLGCENRNHAYAQFAEIEKNQN
jgi:7-cyano-7-deazaguanine synthase in queuosine biosynthesis